jgi:hypothetical protein
MSTPPPGYNAGDSMLSGGTEPIVPVMGGGKRKKVRGSQKGGVNPFVLKPPPTAEAQPENIIDHTKKSVTLTFANTTLNTRLNVLQLMSYIKRMEALWQRRPATENTNVGGTQYITMSAAAASNPVYDKATGSTGQAGFDRLGVMLPKAIKDIVVVPPIHGNIAVYNQYMETVNDYLSTDTAAIIFAAPFYAASSDIVAINVAKAYTDNAAIFQDFVARKMNPATKALMYILTEYTQNSIALGIDVTRVVAKSQRHVITLLEPTYVVYPYDCTLEGDKHSGIIFSAAANGEEHVPDSNSPGKLGLVAAAQNGLPSVAWPPNISVLDSNLEDVSAPYTLYSFLDSNAMDTAGHTFNIFSMSRAMSGGAKNPRENMDEFIVSKGAITAGVTTVPLEGIQYSIRTPDEDVVADWKKLIFTEDEVNFLKALKIRPDMLNEIYDEESWSPDLANNLRTIVQSKCFQDPRMVLHKQCQESQKFIAKILNYWMTNDKYINELEAGEIGAMKAKSINKNKNRNPFTEGDLHTSNVTDINSTIIQIVDTDVFIKHIEVIDPRGKESIGQIRTKAGGFTEATSKINAQYEALKENYPQYTFKIEL